MAAKLLTDFELMVLLAVLRVGDEAYGVPIAREIEETGKRPVIRAVVYATLDRLQARGLVRSTLGEPTAERGGKAKRYYRVSPAGLKAVRDTQRSLVALWTGIPELKGGLA